MSIKLNLRNFRCWEDAVFNFSYKKDDKGNNIEGSNIILLSGRSGHGKSSIFNAIYFCLYGVGNKLKSWGSSSCSVEVEIDNLIITRTKSPNRLLLHNKISDKTYEKDEAQAIINNKFGNFFLTTSYIQQHNINSFVLQGPFEKLNILEKIAFRGLDLSLRKEKNKNFIKTLNEKLISKQSEIDSFKLVIKEIKPEKILFPFKTNNIELSTKNENTRHKNCCNKIKKLTDELLKLEEKYLKEKLAQNTYELKTKELEGVTEKIKKITDKIGNINCMDDYKLKEMKNTLEIYISKKNFICLKERYKNLEKEYFDMKFQEENVIGKRIKELEELLWNKETKKEAENNIYVYKEFLVNTKHKEDLEKLAEENKIDNTELCSKLKEIGIVKKEIEIKSKIEENMMGTYNCPKCDTKLKLCEDSLIYFEEYKDIEISTISDEIKILKTRKLTLEVEISKLKNKRAKFEVYSSQIKEINEKYPEDKWNSVNNIKESLKELEKYLKENLEFLKEKDSLKSRKNYYLLKLEKEVEKLKIQVEAESSDSRDQLENIILNINEDEFKSIILKEENYRIQIAEMRDQLQNYEIDKNKIEKSVKDLSKIDISILEDNIRVIKSEIQVQGDNQKKHLENLELIKKYEEYISKYKIYKEWLEKGKRAEEEEKKIREELTGQLLLKEKINIAESIAVSNIISKINTKVQKYLDGFFKDESITAILSSFKEVKKLKKPTINITIEYKGGECSIESLSGGEKDRVILAFTLALAEITSTEILLLDEPFSALDQKSTNDVVDCLKENWLEKLVILTAHQVVQGVFNSVVEV